MTNIFALLWLSTNEARLSRKVDLGARGARRGAERLPLYDVVTKGTEWDKVNAK